MGTRLSPKLQDWSFDIKWFRAISRIFVGGFTPSAEMQLAYSKVLADRAVHVMVSLFNGISNFVGYLMSKL